MIRKLLTWTLSIMLTSVFLITSAGVIQYFIKGINVSFGTILFYSGSLPFVVFSMSLMGDFFNRGNVSYQLSRSVSGADQGKREIQEKEYFKSIVASQWNWLISGLVVVLISILM